MKCINHPESNYSGICVSCGKPMCDECLINLDKNYCKKCLKERMNKPDEKQSVIVSANANSVGSRGLIVSLIETAAACCCIIIIWVVVFG